MPTFMQWIHLCAAVLGVGGIAFLLFLLIPSAHTLSPEARDALMKKVQGRFRWVSWSVILLLIGSGLYNVRAYYWELAWGRAWELLTAKIVLALLVFGVSLALTVPLSFLAKFRARRERWLATAFALAVIVILISAYLRRS
ncbi:MAG TPA: hypothetical protein VFM21_07180 [Terriglobia bacterium]|nr:hypothetical protein [Terriglobia bacterium]